MYKGTILRVKIDINDFFKYLIIYCNKIYNYDYVIKNSF